MSVKLICVIAPEHKDVVEFLTSAGFEWKSISHEYMGYCGDIFVHYDGQCKFSNNSTGFSMIFSRSCIKKHGIEKLYKMYLDCHKSL